MGWQWHQQDHMQIICTLFQPDNHAIMSSLNFFTGRMLLLMPTNSVKALKAKLSSGENKQLETVSIAEPLQNWQHVQNP